MAKMKRAVGNGKEEDSSSGSKKRRKLSFSEEELTGFDSRSKGSESPPLSKIYNSACRNNKPAELFRKDLISAMKLPDSDQLDPEEFWCVTDTWKQEWERGVQVPVNSKNVPLPKITEIERIFELGNFKLPKRFVKLAQDELFTPDVHTLVSVMEDSEKVCRYDMDDMDCCWLQTLNEEREDLGLPPVEETTVELAMENFENQCFNKFQEAFKTEEGLGIEYDEDVICDVCRTPECEEGNEMVFCDVCNICVHQACYGITAIPDGSWVCRTCASNVQPTCVLCPNKGGAMKSTRSGDQWAHVSCALWIPEVIIVDAEKMEPITKISQIPPSRWSLICTLCRERVGACIQCCVKQCKIAYHVTCAFEHGLEMKGIVDEAKEDDGVKLKSYCLKHSNNNKDVLSASEGVVWKIKNVIKKESKHNKVSDLDKQNARLQRIRTMEAEFYKYVNTKETQKIHSIQADVVDFIFCYWKLKRSANFNKPLIPTKMDEAALLGKHEDSLYARMKMFVHLRQDLERVRNLCYMVSRREKLRRSFFKTKEDIFLKVVETFKSKSLKKNPKELESALQTSTGTSVYDKMYSRKNYVALDKPPVPKEQEEDKAKLGTSARLPNPYAKRYFNGIHTRSRRHTTTSQNSETDIAEKIQLKRSKSEECLSDSPEAFSKCEEKPVVEETKTNENIVKTEPQSADTSDHVEKTSEADPVEDAKSAVEVSESVDPPKQEVHSTEDSKCTDTVFEEVEKEEIPKEEEQLSDLKNSPCQSDKENMVSNSKVRGRKSKSQMDIKSVELSKAIENLSLKTEGETQASDCFKTKNNIIEGEPKLDGSRYLMRSRNRSVNESQLDTGTLFPGKISSSSKSAFNHVNESLPSSDKRLSESADDDEDYKHDEEHTSDTKTETSPTIVKLRRKRRVKRKLFSKVQSDDEQPSRDTTLEFSDTESSDENEMEDEDDDDDDRPLNFTPSSEFKMTLRQGKILWSPRKLALRNSNKLLACDLRHRSFSPLADESSIESEKVEMVDSDSQNSLSETGVDMSKAAPTPHDRNVTSSPRLVLRLIKKDPERQRWQTEEPTSLDALLFKVVRNDWDDAAHNKSDKDDSHEWESLEDFERNYSGHRYMMRKRPKQTTSPS